MKGKRKPAPRAPALAPDEAGTAVEVQARHRLFVQAYLKTKPLNAGAAYREVYACSAAAAETNGPRLLRNAQVQAYLRDQLRMLEARSALTIERIEEELACAAFFDPADLLDPETGATLPLHKWPERARRALVGFEEEALFDTIETGELGPRGGKVKERVQVGVIRKYKWHNKVDAQRLGLQRRGALVEKHEHTVLASEDPTDEELELLAKLRHEVRGKRDA